MVALSQETWDAGNVRTWDRLDFDSLTQRHIVTMSGCRRRSLCPPERTIWPMVTLGITGLSLTETIFASKLNIAGRYIFFVQVFVIASTTYAAGG